MQKMKNEGQHVDKDLEESIEQIQDYDYQNMEPDQVYKLATSFENISRLMTQQNEQQDTDHDQVQESPKQRVKSMKARLREAAKEHGGVKCACVHGICDEGEAECSRCDQGWHGHMCDIPDNADFKKKGSRLSSAKIEDDDEDELIGHGRMGNANQQYEHNEGRRWGKKDSSNEYVPRKAYGNIGKSTSIKDSDEGEEIQPSHKSNNHHVSSKDLDDDDDDYGHGGGGGYYGGGGGASYNASSRAATHAQTTSAPLAN